MSSTSDPAPAGAAESSTRLDSEILPASPVPDGATAPPPDGASAAPPTSASASASAIDLVGSFTSPEPPGVPGQTFGDIEDFKTYLQDWAGDHGFATSCTSSRGSDYYTMRCKKSRGATNCPWSMIVRRFFLPIDKKLGQNPHGRLTWTTTNFEHNHAPMPRGTFAIHRRPSPEVREFIERAGERGDKPRVILNAVRKMEGCKDFDVDMVYYILAQWRRRTRAADEAAGIVPVAGPSQPLGASGEPAAATEQPSEDAHLGPSEEAPGANSQHPRAPRISRLPAGAAPPTDPNSGPQQQQQPSPEMNAPLDGRGRKKPFCNTCNMYVRHHNGICREESRKRKKAREIEQAAAIASYVDAGTQTDPIDILKDPEFGKQIAAILFQARETVRQSSGS